MKKILLLTITLFLSSILFAQTNSTINNTVIQGGVGLGSVIAVVTSWSRNESILWAIFHAIFGWFYVIYFALTRENYE